MANRSKQSRGKARSRGRAVPKRSLLPFYLGLALVGIVGLIFILVNTLNPSPETALSIPRRQPLAAEVGQTAEGFWYKGDPNAPVKIVEYSDYECPACASLEHELLQADFDKQYIETGKVQFIYHELPLTSIHASAQLTAEVARCAGDQKVFWPVHDALFDTQQQWANKPNSRDIILNVAQKAGANRAGIESCLAAGTHTAAVNAAGQAAAAKGLQRTPTVFVNDKEVPFISPFAPTLKNIIDRLAAPETGATQ